MREKLPKILVICGPTCSGKTGVGIALAKAFDGEIIAADSRTVYRELEIGTAKPVADKVLPLLEGGPEGVLSLFAERPRVVEGVPHWGFDLIDPNETFTASEFQAYADQKIADILCRGKLPILVGGTGLYLRAVIDRPNFAGAAPNPALREELEAMTDNDLLEAIALRDPDAAAVIDDQNRRRLIRALEILLTTGGTLAEHRAFGEPMYDTLQIGMDISREDLYVRIDQRVDDMIARGLIDEVRNMITKYGNDAQAMTGIGYRQIGDFFAKKTSLRDAVARIKYDTHHYAKRQETWFRRDARIVWARNVREATRKVTAFLSHEAQKSAAT
jgi:tRNA dimethylallyltransferase